MHANCSTASCLKRYNFGQDASLISISSLLSNHSNAELNLLSVMLLYHKSSEPMTRVLVYFLFASPALVYRCAPQATAPRNISASCSSPHLTSPHLSSLLLYISAPCRADGGSIFKSSWMQPQGAHPGVSASSHVSPLHALLLRSRDQSVGGGSLLSFSLRRSYPHRCPFRRIFEGHRRGLGVRIRRRMLSTSCFLWGEVGCCPLTLAATSPI